LKISYSKTLSAMHHDFAAGRSSLNSAVLSLYLVNWVTNSLLRICYSKTISALHHGFSSGGSSQNAAL